MDSKERFFVIYNEKFGYLKNPRYDERDYMTCQWGMEQRGAYLNHDAHTLKAMILDLTDKYSENCTIKPVLKDKFVHYDQELYMFLINDRSVYSLFSWNGALAERFEMIQESVKEIATVIIGGLPVEQSKLGLLLDYMKQTKTITQFLIDSDSDDETDELEQDLIILDKYIELYEVAFEVCGRKIE